LLGRLLITFISYLIESYSAESFCDVFELGIFKNILDNDSNVDNTDMINLFLANAISFFIVYLFLNMYVSTKSKMRKMCNSKIDKYIIIIGIVLNILIPMLIKPNFIENVGTTSND
jgi:hypothetical protein